MRYFKPLVLLCVFQMALFARPALSQDIPVTAEGFGDLRAGCNFYLEVPMIDNDLGGIGDAITAESIINNVRYAGGHDEIKHVVFKMKTGGGKMFHADAMAEVIEEYHDRLEFHIVIEDAISAGTWTAFSCDNIFMCEGGSIGGVVIYITLPDGTVRAAPDIPRVAAQMSIMAERNGHAGALLPAMMYQPAELHFWRENGEPVLSNRPPRSIDDAADYKMLDRSTDVLTLTTDQAIEIGLAEPIDDFDATLVGEKIGVPQWTRANQYGKVIDEIGALYNITRPMEDRYLYEKLELPFVRRTRDNRNNPQVIALNEQRAALETMVKALRQVNEALNNLPYCHPEKHIYFAGDDGQTIVSDPDQWIADAQQARTYNRQLAAGMRDLRIALRQMEVDQKNVSDIEDRVQMISARIEGIAVKGNAAYWAEEDDD